MGEVMGDFEREGEICLWDFDSVNILNFKLFWFMLYFDFFVRLFGFVFGVYGVVELDMED